MPPKATWNQLGERQVTVIFGRGQIDNILGETQAAVISGRGQFDNILGETQAVVISGRGQNDNALGKRQVASYIWKETNWRHLGTLEYVSMSSAHHRPLIWSNYGKRIFYVHLIWKNSHLAVTGVES